MPLVGLRVGRGRVLGFVLRSLFVFRCRGRAVGSKWLRYHAHGSTPMGILVSAHIHIHVTARFPIVFGTFWPLHNLLFPFRGLLH